MAIQKISVKDIIILSQGTEITAQIPKGIQQFFDDNFDFLQWKWTSKYEFWNYLNRFYPESMDYQSSIIYLDEGGRQKKQQLIESLAWIIQVLQCENNNVKDLQMAFELVCIVPNFWQVTAKENIRFSVLAKNIALNFIKNINFEIKSWLSVVNQYPVRFPWLQLGLGKFLTTSTNQETVFYIESINLKSSSEDIKQCVGYFFEHANEIKQKYFCEQAFQKWNQWDFDKYPGVSKSCLDRAIVKYFQFQSLDKIEEFIQLHLKEISTFQNKWFDNMDNLNKFIYYHLSRIQPACIAYDLNNDKNLKLEDFDRKEYVPTYFPKDLRWKNWVKDFGKG